MKVITAFFISGFIFPAYFFSAFVLYRNQLSFYAFLFLPFLFGFFMFALVQSSNQKVAIQKALLSVPISLVWWEVLQSSRSLDRLYCYFCEDEVQVLITGRSLNDFELFFILIYSLIGCVTGIVVSKKTPGKLQAEVFPWLKGIGYFISAVFVLSFVFFRVQMPNLVD